MAVRIHAVAKPRNPAARIETPDVGLILLADLLSGLLHRRFQIDQSNDHVFALEEGRRYELVKLELGYVHIYQKLDVSSRAAAALFSVEHGLLA